jgi:hypothetical protein
MDLVTEIVCFLSLLPTLEEVFVFFDLVEIGNGRGAGGLEEIGFLLLTGLGGFRETLGSSISSCTSCCDVVTSSFDSSDSKSGEGMSSKVGGTNF